MTTTVETIENWDELNIKTELLRGIYSYGFEKPSEIQKRSIPELIKGNDVIAQAQSGMGKTGAFSISTLELIDCTKPKLQALLLAHTHELVKQTLHVIKSLGSVFPISL